jgi:hypothetical protein
MAQKVRVGGGFTVFYWSNSTDPGGVIGFADRVQVQAVTPVAQPVAVQPLNALRPLEIVTPRAHTYGVLTLTLTDLYNQAVWQRLAGLAKSNDIIQIMEYMASLNNGVQITKYVEPPSGNTYVETFYNCMIARVDDNEDIRIDTMVVNKDIEVWYTYNRKHWINSAAEPATFT